MNYVLSIHHCSGNSDRQKPLIPENYSFNPSVTFSQNRVQPHLSTHPRNTQHSPLSFSGLTGESSPVPSLRVRQRRTKQSHLDSGVSDINEFSGDNSLNESLSNSLFEIRNSKWCCSDTNEISENNELNGFLVKLLKVYACPQTDNGKLGNSEPWKINGINDNSDNNELNESTAGKEISL